MKERIQKYMDFKNINAGELATRLEVQRSNISHILNGRNKPSAAFIEKMLTIFPDLDARWLLTGQGDMTLSQHNGSSDNVAKDISKQIKEEAANQTQEGVSLNELSKDRTSEHAKINFTDESIDKIVLLFKDGTFSSFKNRSEKN